MGLARGGVKSNLHGTGHFRPILDTIASRRQPRPGPPMHPQTRHALLTLTTLSPIATLLLLACDAACPQPVPAPPARVMVLCDTASLPLVQPALQALGDPRATALLASAATSTDGAWIVHVSQSSACPDCFTASRSDRTLTITGGLPRGVQYGVTTALEWTRRCSAACNWCWRATALTRST